MAGELSPSAASFVVIHAHYITRESIFLRACRARTLFMYVCQIAEHHVTYDWEVAQNFCPPEWIPVHQGTKSLTIGKWGKAAETTAEN